MQGYRKEPLFHTKRRSDRDRESNPGHLHGRQCRKTLSHPLRLNLKDDWARAYLAYPGIRSMEILRMESLGKWFLAKL
jgi:hypothetical protein